MRLTDESLQTYIRCPMQYKLQIVDKREPHRKPVNLLYKDNLKKIFSFFYFSLMESRNASLKTLLSKWSTVWFSKKNIRLYGFNLLEEFSNQGVFLIQRFHRLVKMNPGTPIAVDFRYSYIFESVGVNVDFCGSIDLIRIISAQKKELIKYDNSSRRPTDFEVSRDLSLSLYSFIFRNLFGRRERNVTIFHTNTASLLTTKRSNHDRDYVKQVIFTVADAIDNKIFYPRVEHNTCKYCLWKSYCKGEFSN